MGSEPWPICAVSHLELCNMRWIPTLSDSIFRSLQTVIFWQDLTIWFSVECDACWQVAHGRQSLIYLEIILHCSWHHSVTVNEWWPLQFCMALETIVRQQILSLAHTLCWCSSSENINLLAQSCKAARVPHRHHQLILWGLLASQHVCLAVLTGHHFLSGADTGSIQKYVNVLLLSMPATFKWR